MSVELKVRVPEASAIVTLVPLTKLMDLAAEPLKVYLLVPSVVPLSEVITNELVTLPALVAVSAFPVSAPENVVAVIVLPVALRSVNTFFAIG